MPIIGKPKVGDLLAHAQKSALQSNTEVQKQWIAGSFDLVSKSGISEISFYIQELGKLDVLLRSLEAERTVVPTGQKPTEKNLLCFDLQASFSRQWILSAYEVTRTLDEHWKDPDRRLQELLRRLTLVRIPLAKLRIAQDRALGQREIQLIRRGDPIENAKTYTAKNPVSYWPQLLLDSGTGSIGWNVVDIKNQSEADITRQSLSDDFLILFQAVNNGSAKN